MYLRTTERRNKDGSVVRYLALAHNERTGGATKANVLPTSAGDRLDPTGCDADEQQRQTPGGADGDFIASGREFEARVGGWHVPRVLART